MPNSFIRKKDHLHHPEHATAGSISNGRHLEPEAVKLARVWRENMHAALSHQPIPALSFKQRHLLRELKIEFDKKALRHTRGPARLS